MRLLIPVVLLFLMIGTACKNSTKPTTDEIMEKVSKAPGLNAGVGTYSIHTPEGWIKKDTSMNGIKILFIYPPDEAKATFHPNLNIISEAMGGLSYEAYMKQNLQTMQQYITNFHIIDSGKIQANDMQGKWIHYTQTQNGQDMENIFYVLSKNGIAYGITATTPKGGMDAYHNDFEGVVKTLQVQ